jgi:hypothetical protein
VKLWGQGEKWTEFYLIIINTFIRRALKVHERKNWFFFIPVTGHIFLGSNYSFF